MAFRNFLRGVARKKVFSIGPQTNLSINMVATKTKNTNPKQQMVNTPLEVLYLLSK